MKQTLLRRGLQMTMSRWTPLAALLLIGATASKAALSQESRYVLSVDVELVNVNATVIDESGKYLEGLTADDFRVLEDGHEQKLAYFSHDSRVPLSIGVLVDISGSIQDKVRQALQTVREIAATLTPNDEMFLITFNSRVDVRQQFTSNPEQMQRALVDIHTGGETAVYDAISAGVREMQKAKHQKRILLLVSDGFDTKSKINAAQAEDLLKRSEILLYAVGIDDDDKNPPRGRPKYHIYEYMLNKLASAARGRVIRLYTGRNYDLRRLSELILDEMHQEYTMGYYPAATLDNASLRTIEVRVTKPGARVLGERLRLQRRESAATNR